MYKEEVIHSGAKSTSLGSIRLDNIIDIQRYHNRKLCGAD